MPTLVYLVEYYDDHAVIPRSTSVLARRLPPSKPGRGNGQIYMAAIEGNSGAPSTGSHGGGGGGGGGGGQGWKNGGSSMSKRFDGKDDFRGGRNGNGSGQSEEMKSSSLQVRYKLALIQSWKISFFLTLFVLLFFSSSLFFFLARFVLFRCLRFLKLIGFKFCYATCCC